ncbi:MAG TPA: hypothetical protein VFI84_03625, partial [Candidatus Saccharimonadales bacterium]|nr:hypothetical protein [Candidatus Saccharimonadales bacterium]
FSGVTGFGALAAHEINTMPTPRIEQGVQHDMERQQMQQGELSQDELHARHQIDIQQSRERAQQIAVEVKH